MAVTKTETEARQDSIMDLRDVTVRFDMERGTSRVLDNVNIDIEREEILGVVGESGSGKSMFASALLDAVVDPGKLSGDITYTPEDGEPVDILDLSDEELKEYRWEAVSMVFQGAQSSFNPTMKIEGHFRETLIAHDKDIEEGLEFGRQLLEDLYLDPDRIFNSYPHELSGGMQQRALIALSLLLKPEVLVMDEPTAALDLLMQRSIITLLADLQEEYDLTIVLITHDLPLVAGLADRLAVMYAFDFVERGPSEEIIRNATHPYTRALLKSVPSTNMPIEEMTTIEGSSPDPVNDPTGCSYHPRCPLATQECKTTDPSYSDVSENHETACFHWEDSAEEIPYTLSEEAQDLSLTPSENKGTQVPDPIVSIDELDIHFENQGLLDRLSSGEKIVRAVDDVSLDIGENDIVALVGESGCGKTTLGKSAIGLQRPTDGNITYRGQDIWESKDKEKDLNIPFMGGDDVDIPFTDIRRALQIVHQDPGSALNSSRTVLASLSAPLKRWYPDMSPNRREEQIYQLLERVGMSPPEDYASRYPHQLSGGEKQRVALTRALLMGPDLILADEAVSALDVSLRVEMMDLMLELQEMFNTSYLFISHDLSNARYLAEKGDGRIGVMYLGEIVEIGTPEQIIHNPKHPYTKVLSWATPELDPEKAKETTEQGPPVREIDVPDPVDPPSGCKFHTRCPEAREACTRQSPELTEAEDGSVASCFRQDPDHEYWDSPSITEEESQIGEESSPDAEEQAGD